MNVAGIGQILDLQDRNTQLESDNTALKTDNTALKNRQRTTGFRKPPSRVITGGPSKAKGKKKNEDDAGASTSARRRRPASHRRGDWRPRRRRRRGRTTPAPATDRRTADRDQRASAVAVQERAMPCGVGQQARRLETPRGGQGRPRGLRRRDRRRRSAPRRGQAQPS